MTVDLEEPLKDTTVASIDDGLHRVLRRRVDHRTKLAGGDQRGDGIA